MARLIFYPVNAPTGSTVRIDTASGSDTPADITPVGRPSQSISGSRLVAGRELGRLPAIHGPDGVTTLYQKQLNYLGVAGALLATLTGVTEPSPPVISGGSAAPASYGLAALGKGDLKVPIFLRTHAAFDAASNGTDTQISFQNFQPCTDPAADTAYPMFANQGVNTAGGAPDTDAPNQIYVAFCVITSDGRKIPATFGGQHFLTIPAGGGLPLGCDNGLFFGAQVAATDKYGVALPLTGVNTVTTVKVDPSRVDTVTNTSGTNLVSDTSVGAADNGRLVSGTGVPGSLCYACNIVPGTSFQLSSTPVTSGTPTLVNSTAAITSVTFKSQIPFNIGALASTDACSTNGGADATLPGSAAPSGGAYSYYYGPAVMFGRSSLKKPILLTASDSIADGYGDDYRSPYFGFIARGAMANGVPMVKVSRGGETSSSFVAPLSSGFRVIYEAGCTHAYVGYGTNDGINSPAQVTNIINRLIAIGAGLVARGIKPILMTVPPRTSSVDQWMTPEGQTAVSVIAYLASLNQQIRALPAPYVAIYDMEADCSSAQDSGVWGNRLVRTSSIGTTNASSAITDTAVASTDGGRLVVAAGIPYPSYIGVGTITAGAGYTLSSTSATSTPRNATATATVSVGVYKSKTGDGVHPDDQTGRTELTARATTQIAGLTV